MAVDTPLRKDDTVIGQPIPVVTAIARQFIAEGKDVRIFTARAYHMNEATKQAIEDWCELHLGKVLPIQAHKDSELLYFFDDRAQCVNGSYFQKTET